MFCLSAVTYGKWYGQRKENEMVEYEYPLVIKELCHFLFIVHEGQAKSTEAKRLVHCIQVMHKVPVDVAGAGKNDGCSGGIKKRREGNGGVK